MKYHQCLIILMGSLTIAFAQRVAPGVPPQHYVDPNQQHYQQAPPVQYVQPGQGMHQQHHQPIQQQPIHQQPIHQQQPMQQQQQQPIQPQQPIHQQHPNTLQQQQQQQQPIGGVPQHQMHTQHVLDTANLQGEKAHIQEHMDVPIDTSKMSEQELQFHYFKMHDSDHNNMLDGCELIKSLIHWHEKTTKDSAHHEEGAHGAHQEKIFSDEELVALIDPILAMDDTGRDGYIDYPEFIKAQQKAASQKAEKP